MIKPFAGPGQEVASDAVVMQPVLESPAGLAMSSVLLTEYGDIDTYHMITASVEEGYRAGAGSGRRSNAGGRGGQLLLALHSI